MDPPPPFINGQEVEVTSQEPGFEGSWFLATLIRKSTKKNDNFVVEYQNLLDDQGLKPLKEYVELKNIRPPQPQEPPKLFKENEEVDAFHNDGWWKGVIAKDLENSCYLVEFQSSNEALIFKQSDLRSHLEWIDGKWINLAKQDQEVTVAELEKKVGGQKKTDVSMSIRACSERGMSTGICNDVETHSMFSSPSAKDENVGGQKTTDVSMSIRACSERGMSTGICNDVEAHSMFSSPFAKGRRSKIEIRRARNSFSSELFFNSSGSPTRGNHVSMEICEEKSKDDLESKSSEIKVSTACSHLNSDLMEVESSVVLMEEEHVVLPTKQMKETSTPEKDRVNKRFGITVRRKRGRPKGSGKKKKAKTSGSPDFRIISPLKGPENESSSTKNTIVQTQCSELPTSSTAENAKTPCSELPSSTVDKTQCSELPSLAVDNHQMSSVHLERCGTSAVRNTGTETEAGNRTLIDEFYNVQMKNIKVDMDQTRSTVDRTQCSELPSVGVDNHQMSSVHPDRSSTSAVRNTGTETEAGNRNLIDEFYNVQMESTKVDMDQTLNLVPEMSNNPTNEIGLESESACTENIAVGTVLDFVCPPTLSLTIEEHQTLSSTSDHANQATESKAGMDMPDGEINQDQVPCPSILEKPLIVENNEDIQDPLDEAMDERDTPLDGVMDLQQPSIAPQNSPPPVIHEVQQIQLFEKKSAMWKLLEGLEVFKSNPQNPHFQPLENEQEELREGKAFGYMCIYESLVSNTSNASIEEERHVFGNWLRTLDELEEHGFKVSSMRWKLEKMVEIKDMLDEVGNRPDSSKLEIEEAENELEDLKRQLETLFAREEKVNRNLARLRKLRDEADERARQLKLEFYHVASAP